jgi:hypothetical protein
MSKTSNDRYEKASQYLQKCIGRLLADEGESASERRGASWDVVRGIARKVAQRGWSAFLVGGALRDLALSGGTQPPRDFDFVFCNVSRDELEEEFTYLSKAQRTSLGGLRFSYREAIVDMWPLHESFSIKHKAKAQIQDLTNHAFLNVEAIAIEIVPGKGKSRLVVENGFSDAVRQRALDINYEDNPFPEVCVVKAIRTAIVFNLSVGHRLADYILKRRWDLNALVEAQEAHYREVIFDKPNLQVVLEILSKWDNKNGKLYLTSPRLESTDLARSKKSAETIHLLTPKKPIGVTLRRVRTGQK